MTLHPETKEERLRGLFQIVKNNLALLTEIKNALERAADEAVKILNEKTGGAQ